MEKIFNILNKTKEKDSSKGEHLKEGVSPIIACIGTPEQFNESEGLEQEAFKSPVRSKNNSSNINYYEEPENLAKQNFKNAGHRSYVISSVDNSNKFSTKYMNCTGLVVAGIEKESGKNISFLSHQDPKFFLIEEGYDNFIRDLRQQLQEIKARCEEGTIDAVIFGGNYFNEYPSDSEYQEDYKDSVGLLAKASKTILGFEPIVVAGPKKTEGSDNVFYDNENRRLYISRPEVARESTKSYKPSDIEEKEKAW